MAKNYIIILLFSNLIFSGWLSGYDKTPTLATMNYHIEIGSYSFLELYVADIHIAVLDCSRIGDKGKLYYRDEIYNFIVFDCAGNDGGYNWMIENYIVAELSYYSDLKYPHLLHNYAFIVYDEEK